MHPGVIIGRVVASHKYETLVGAKLLLVQPTDWSQNPDGDPLIAIDTVGAGAAEFIFYVQSREAAVTMEAVPPVDAAIVGIIDGVTLEDL